jgi:cytochrome c556
MLRRLTVPALVFSGLCLFATGASAQDRTHLSEYRAALMEGLRAHTGGLRSLVTGEVSHPDHVVLQARAAADVADMLQGVWPEGSGGDGTRALPAVWEDPDDFKRRLDALRDATARLRERAEAGDMEGVGAALQDVGGMCRDCHTTYRARAN